MERFMTLVKNDIPEDLRLAFSDLKSRIENFDRVQIEHVKYFYAASLIEPDYAEKFRQLSASEEFWENGFPDSIDSADEIYYITKLDLPNKDGIDQIISDCILDSQNRHGYIMNDHAEALRILINTNRYSNHTDLALKYFLQFIQNLSALSNYDLVQIPAGMLALMELDFDKYKYTLSELAEFLISKQLKNGSFDYSDNSDQDDDIPIHTTCISIVALSRFLGPDNPYVVSAVNCILTNRPPDGWRYHAPDVCIALVEAGLGQKISKAVSDWNTELLHQRNSKGLPYFIHTSPIFGGKIHIKQIHDRILEMLRRAEKEVLISSLYVDMMYEELINMANRGLSIRIIMRPGKDAKGLRERINKNVVELLKIATRGNTRVNEICQCSQTRTGKLK
jgi:hypothetical protein